MALAPVGGPSAAGRFRASRGGGDGGSCTIAKDEVERRKKEGDFGSQGNGIGPKLQSNSDTAKDFSRHEAQLEVPLVSL